MTRALTAEYKGAFYHITCRGNDRNRIFFNKTDYAKFKSYLEEGLKRKPSIIGQTHRSAPTML